jgi:immunoglobulin-like protein involved in spore germination
VFEATVSIRILDANGREIAAAFTTATCGTGCRGRYSARVSYDVGADQVGTIEVFASSAQDGHTINVVRIPVTLTA